MADGDNTAWKHRGLMAPFKAGESGNPTGRPKGSRTKLGEAFVQALHADFAEHGVAAIEKVRQDHPDQYLKIIASLLPKQVEVKDGAFDGVSDEELTALVTAARLALGSSEDDGQREGSEVEPKSLN